MLKRLLTALLLLSIFLPACSNNEITPLHTGEPDFGGDTFKFIVTGFKYGFGYYETIDVYTEEQDGTTLNDAVYIRNRLVEDLLNINIAEYKSDNVLNSVTRAVNATERAYDAVFTNMYESSVMAREGLTVDLLMMKYINLDNLWWDKNAEEDLSIRNKLFFTTGDISTSAKSCVRFLVFNKKLIVDYKMESPYEYVENDTWTFDVYSQMVKSLYVDVNGDGRKDDGDIYGTILETNNPYFMIYGFGERLTANDADGYPIITCNNERFVYAAQQIFNLYFDDNICRHVNNISMPGRGRYFNPNFYAVKYARSLFADNKFLFHLMYPLAMEELRGMEADFGVLPCPKLNEFQESYHHVVDSNAVMLSIPITFDEYKSGIVLEALAKESKQTLTPEYNETLLRRKYIRDNESEFILDIIQATQRYDLCAIYNWGGLYGLMGTLTELKNENLISSIEQLYYIASAEINNTVKIFEGEN